LADLNRYKKILSGLAGGHVQEWLNEGVIGLGVLYDVNAARHLRVTPLLIEELFLVVSAGGWPHEVGDDGIAKKPVTLAECAEFGLILLHRTHGLREMIERFAHTQGVNLHIILEMDSLAHIKALIARGLGYGILAHAGISLAFFSISPKCAHMPRLAVHS